METRNRQCTCKGPVAGRGRSGTDWRGGLQSARTRIRRHWPSRASHCQTPGTRRNDQRRSQVEAAFVLGAIHAHSPNHAPRRPSRKPRPFQPHTRARPVNPGRARQRRHAPPTSCPGYPASPQRVGQSGAAARRGRGPCEHKRPETHTVSGAVTMTTGALAPPRTQPGTRPRAGGGGRWGVSPAVRSASRPRPLRNRVTFCPGLNSLLNSTFTESLLCPEARDPPPNRSDSKQNPALGWLIPGGRVRKGRNQRA